MVQFNIITFKKSYSQKIMNSKDKTKALEYIVRKKETWCYFGDIQVIS